MLQPDPQHAAQLLAKGYRVHPCTGHKKYPAQKAWQKATHEQCQEAFRATSGITGWSLVVAPDDPEALVVLDIDTKGERPLEAVCEALGLSLDAATPVTRSARGGFHLYFRHPASHKSQRLPSALEHNGVPMDIRQSVVGRAGLVLPGSVVVADSKFCQYEQIQGDFADLGNIPELPRDLFTLLHANKAEGDPKDTREGEHRPATEMRDFLGIIDKLAPVQDNWSALFHQVGRIGGRISGNPQGWTKFFNDALPRVRDRLDFSTGKEFNHVKATDDFKRGWLQGCDNVKKYTKPDPNPTVDMVRQQFRSDFGEGAVVRLEEHLTVAGKQDGYMLLVESPELEKPEGELLRDKTPEEFFAILLRKLPGTDRNTVARSPLYTMRKWFKLLWLDLLTERDRIQDSPPRDFNLEWLDKEARSALLGRRYGKTQIDGRDASEPSVPWMQLDVRTQKFYLMFTKRFINRKLRGLDPEYRTALVDLTEVCRHKTAGEFRRWEVSGDTLAYVRAEYQRAEAARKTKEQNEDA